MAKSCDWCGRPESEQAVEPVVINNGGGMPMSLCEECRGVEPSKESIRASLDLIAKIMIESEESSHGNN